MKQKKFSKKMAVRVAINTAFIVISLAVFVLFSLSPYFFYPYLQSKVFSAGESELAIFIYRDSSAPIASLLLIFLSPFIFATLASLFFSSSPKIKFSPSLNRAKPYLIIMTVMLIIFSPFFVFTFDTYTYFTKDKLCQSELLTLGKACFALSKIDEVRLKADFYLAGKHSNRERHYYAYEVVVDNKSYGIWDNNGRQFDKARELNTLILEQSPEVKVSTEEVDNLAITWLEAHPDGTHAYSKENIADLLSIFTSYKGSLNFLFQQFKAKDIYSGQWSFADFSTNPERRMFFTRINEAAYSAPNFAGGYTIVTWGCGSPCLAGVMVDKRNGAIIDIPTGSYGIEYRVDSNLLIVNPPQEDGCNLGSAIPCETEYYLWENSRFKPLTNLEIHK